MCVYHNNSTRLQSGSRYASVFTSIFVFSTNMFALTNIAATPRIGSPRRVLCTHLLTNTDITSSAACPQQYMKNIQNIKV